MSRNSRRSRRRTTAVQRIKGKSWFQRYLKALRTGIAITSIGGMGLLSQSAYGANDTWLGNGATPVFTDPLNWTPGLPVSNDTLQFGAAGTNGTTLTDDLTTPAAFNIAGITFTVGASSYTINPGAPATNGFTLTGGITNNSTAAQVINDPIITTANRPILRPIRRLRRRQEEAISRWVAQSRELVVGSRRTVLGLSPSPAQILTTGKQSSMRAQ